MAFLNVSFGRAYVSCPDPPLCFEEVEWREWWKAAKTASVGQTAIDPCADCEVSYRLCMQKQGRCDIGVLVQSIAEWESQDAKGRRPEKCEATEVSEG